jgi:opacity protein-like surface antigen
VTRTLGAVVVFVLAAVPAAAQSMELGALAGFIPSTSLDRKAPELKDVQLEGGATFAFNVARFQTEHWGIAGEWTQHFSGLGIETRTDAQETLYDINISTLHGYAVYRFRGADAKARPFAFGGAGIKYFTAHDLDAETKLSFGVGGGLSYFLERSLAIEGRFTYKPTIMNDRDAGDFCDAFGYCQSTLQQFELMGGVRFRF